MGLSDFSLNTNASRISGELNVLKAVIKKEWLHLVRYPSWIIRLILWPLLFPAAYILTANAFAGPQEMALSLFLKAAGTPNYMGFIIIGTTVYMWQNIVLWDIGLALRNEQLRGTLIKLACAYPKIFINYWRWYRPAPFNHFIRFHHVFRISLTVQCSI